MTEDEALCVTGRALALADLVLTIVSAVNNPVVVQMALYTAAVRYSLAREVDPSLESCKESVEAAFNGLLAVEQLRAERAAKN